MKAMILAFFGLLYLLSVKADQTCQQKYLLLETKVKNLEIQVQIFSSLLQTQSSIISKYITQGQCVAGTKCCDIRVKIENQANKIKALEKKLDRLDTLNNTQKIIRWLADDLLKLITTTSIVSTSNTASSVDTKMINQKLVVLEGNGKTRDIQMKRLESSMTSINTWITQNKKEKEGLEKLIQVQASQISQLQSSVQQGIWTSEKYCILANGSCPVGFTRKTAWMKAMKVFRGTLRFFKEENFGDSYIRCNGPCSRSDQWLGQLTIVACCK